MRLFTQTILTQIFILSALMINSTAFAKSTIGGVIFINNYSHEKRTINQTTGERSPSNRKTQIELASNSRIRTRWSNEDNVGMYIEIGIGNPMSLRHAYGTWQITENWQILAGQTTTPFAPLNPSVAMLHNSGQSVGSVSPGRQPQVRLTYRLTSKQGAVALALTDPNKGALLKKSINNQNSGFNEKSAEIPRIDLGFAYKTFHWQLFPGMFYQRQNYTPENSMTVNHLDSWGLSLGAKRGFSAWVVAFEYGIGQNWGNTAMSQSGSPAGDNAGAIIYQHNGINKLATNNNQNFWIDIGYRFTLGEIKGTVHFIHGQSSSKLTDLNQHYRSTMSGISLPMDLPWIARGFRIRPEFFIFDNGNNYATSTNKKYNAGKENIAGIQMQYTF